MNDPKPYEFDTKPRNVMPLWAWIMVVLIPVAGCLYGYYWFSTVGDKMFRGGVHAPK